LVLESPDLIELNADRIYTVTVVSKIMPIGNLTGMTAEERNLVAAWYGGLDRAEKSSTGAAQ
jgi:uncharacterized membrane protein